MIDSARAQAISPADITFFYMKLILLQENQSLVLTEKLDAISVFLKLTSLLGL